MQLMIVSSPVSFKGESKLINDLFENGLEVFHLRRPESGKKEYKEILAQIDVQYYDRIALHQHHELIFDYKITRLHFPERLRKELTDQTPDLNRLDSGTMAESCKRKILSTSVHRIEDIETLYNFDYVFFGPVFDSYSKWGYKGILENGSKLTEDHHRRQNQDQVCQADLRKESTKVIALGGIGLNTIGRMKQMGFDGAAMLGWIWNDPLKAIDNFKQVKCWVKDHM